MIERRTLPADRWRHSGWRRLCRTPALDRHLGGVPARVVDVQLDGFEISPGVWVAEGAEVHPDAVLRGPVYIGDYATKLDAARGLARVRQFVPRAELEPMQVLLNKTP